MKRVDVRDLLQVELEKIGLKPGTVLHYTGKEMFERSEAALELARRVHEGDEPLFAAATNDEIAYIFDVLLDGVITPIHKLIDGLPRTTVLRYEVATLPVYFKGYSDWQSAQALAAAYPDLYPARRMWPLAATTIVGMLVLACALKLIFSLLGW